MAGTANPVPRHRPATTVAAKRHRFPDPETTPVIAATPSRRWIGQHRPVSRPTHTENHTHRVNDRLACRRRDTKARRIRPVGLTEPEELTIPAATFPHGI